MTGLYINGMEPNHFITFNLRCLVSGEYFLAAIIYMVLAPFFSATHN